MGRGGYAFNVGFPVKLRGEYIFRAIRSGHAVADVREVGRDHPRCARRLVVAIWLPVECRLGLPFDSVASAARVF